MTPPIDCGTAAQLGAYTQAVLQQMISVMQPYLDKPHKPYGEHVGAHFRHIIEHYETLIRALQTDAARADHPAQVDYDARARDLDMETQAPVALTHIRAAQAAWAGLTEQRMAQAVEVHTRGGLLGDLNFCTPSCVGRELMFLNSHATHHFAILQGYARERGDTLGPGLGKAPATVAYERQQQAHLEDTHS